MCGTRSPRIVVTQSPTSCDDRGAEVRAAMVCDTTRSCGRGHSRPAAGCVGRARSTAGAERVAARPDGTADAASLAPSWISNRVTSKAHRRAHRVRAARGGGGPTLAVSRPAETWMRFSRLVVAVERQSIRRQASRSDRGVGSDDRVPPGAETDHREARVPVQLDVLQGNRRALRRRQLPAAGRTRPSF